MQGFLLSRLLYVQNNLRFRNPAIRFPVSAVRKADTSGLPSCIPFSYARFFRRILSKKKAQSHFLCDAGFRS